MSKITIVDKNDNVIGEEDRKFAYGNGDIHRLIRVFLINSKGELLLQWRGKEEDTFPETWDQSAGGHVDAGEDYETAAYRELEEELGVSEVKLELVDKFYTSGEMGWKKINRFNAIFIAKYDKDDFVLQSDEVEKVQWFGVDKLYELIESTPDDFTHGLRTVLRDYKEVILEYRG